MSYYPTNQMTNRPQPDPASLAALCVAFSVPDQRINLTLGAALFAVTVSACAVPAPDRPQASRRCWHLAIP